MPGIRSNVDTAKQKSSFVRQMHGSELKPEKVEFWIINCHKTDIFYQQLFLFFKEVEISIFTG